MRSVFFTSQIIGAYTANKKEVLIIIKNEPLLFVSGPPIYNRVIFKYEESTSVFVLNGEELEMAYENVEIEQSMSQEESLILSINPSVRRRINYLELPFSRQVYKPLQFVMGEETLTGTIESIVGETVVIEIDEEEKKTVTIDMRTIDDILWRGTSFSEN